MAEYIGAIDQGTTSTRFMVFDKSGKIIATAQKEHEQIYPKPGWVEHNPDEIWQLTGGTNGGIHVTDVTNASRTQLMNLETLNWDADILKTFNIPQAMLPKICSSSEVYGNVKVGAITGVAIAGDLGDQQAALVGQTCCKPGQARTSYGTGS